MLALSPEQENQRLRERIAELEGLLFEPSPVLYIEVGLTKYEYLFVTLLLKRAFATKEQVFIALYAGQAGELPQPEVINVHLTKARKKLQPFGVEIVTKTGVGFYMSPASKAILREMGVNVCQGTITS